MKKKKSLFWLFVFSLFPGAGHMYLGFMKMGVSLTFGFLLTAAFVGFVNLGWLAVVPVTIYFYSFFHANNLGRMDDSTFEAMEDNYFFGMDSLDDVKAKLGGKYRSIAAVILIILGVAMLWDLLFEWLCDIFGWDNLLLSRIFYFVRDDLPRLVVGIVIIWLGIMLMRGKKKEIFSRDAWDKEEGKDPIEKSGMSE